MPNCSIRSLVEEGRQSWEAGSKQRWLGKGSSHEGPSVMGSGGWGLSLSFAGASVCMGRGKGPDGKHPKLLASKQPLEGTQGGAEKFLQGQGRVGGEAEVRPPPCSQTLHTMKVGVGGDGWACVSADSTPSPPPAP